MIGFDIGGTKCAVCIGAWHDGEMTVTQKQVFPTPHDCSPYEVLDRMCALAEQMTDDFSQIGISCGGPLDSRQGVILSPPNLPGWDHVQAVAYLQKKYGGKVKLQNDANACAIAEWKFGAGRGCNNMIFLTFGTGFGAGLILDGRLYEGTCGNAGEVGHVRMERFGPTGFGKIGSWEGFCSGGGIAQLGYSFAMQEAQQGRHPLYFQPGMNASDITAKSIAEAAQAGDPTAIEVYRTSGRYLGRGLAMLIDILNPEAIVIGSVFARSQELMVEAMQEEIQKEALPSSAACCRVLPAALGEKLGDYAAIAAAMI